MSLLCCGCGESGSLGPPEGGDPAPVDGREPDADLDGYPADVDCDDTESTVYPGARERCDGLDNDCDGELRPDEGDADADGYPECEDCDDTDPTSHGGLDRFADEDGDGWTPCDDCDDDDRFVHPEADELCEVGDENCDGIDAAPFTVWDGPAPVGVVGIDGVPTRFTRRLEDRFLAENDGFGTAVLIAGDTDGDGLSEILVATSEVTPRARVFSGPFCVGGAVPAFAAVGTLELTENRENISLQRLGDINGDGLADVRAGQCIYFGPLTSYRSCNSADIVLYHSAGETALGDFNGDGVTDMAVANFLTSNQAGAVFIHYGPLGPFAYLAPSNADATLVGAVEGGLAGTSISTLPDSNADGADELAVVVVNEDGLSDDNEGAVYIWESPYPELGDLGQASTMLTGLGPPGGVRTQYLGNAVVYWVGDEPSLVVATHRWTGDEPAWVLPLPVPAGSVSIADVGHPVAFSGERGWLHTVEVIGDMDGDGRPEWLGGSAFSERGVLVFEGPVQSALTEADAIRRFDPQIGSASGGDVNGDGYDDLLLGLGGFGGAWLFYGGPDDRP